MDLNIFNMNYQKVYMNQIYSSSVMGQLSQMWKNQLLCDAVIKTGSVTTKAHRLVLIAACPMLQHLENASLGSHLEVRMAPDIKKESILSFLQYLYEGYMILTEENCKDIEKMGKLLQVEGVVKCCSDFYQCLKAKTGVHQGSGPQFNYQDSVEFRHVRATDIQKMVQENSLKRSSELVSPVGKRQRLIQTSSPPAYQRTDDRASMSQSYHPESKDPYDRLTRADTETRKTADVIEIVEDSLEVVHKDPAERDLEGWPKDSDLPPVQRTQSISVSSQLGSQSDIQVINIDSEKDKRSSSASSSALNTAKETTTVRHSVPHDQSHSTHSLERHSFDSSSARRDTSRFPELQRNDIPRLNDGFQLTSTPVRVPATSSPSVSSFSPKMPPLQPKPFAAGSAMQVSVPQNVQGRSSIPAGTSVTVQPSSDSPVPVTIQSSGIESQSQSTERVQPASMISTSTASPAQKMSTGGEGGGDQGQSVEQLLAGEGIHEQSSKRESPSVTDEDLQIVKIEESDTGGLDMYVDIPEENKSMLQSQMESEVAPDDPGEPSSDWGREEVSNEGSNFSGDQGVSWQGQDGSFQGHIEDGIYTTGQSFSRNMCRLCRQTFFGEKQLESHYKSVHGIAEVCKCGRYFRSSHAFRFHYKIKHAQKRDIHTCPICGKTSDYVSSMKRHIATHSLEKPYECPHCDKAYRRKDCLKQHILTHVEVPSGK